MRKNVLEQYRVNIGDAAQETLAFCERRGWSVALYEVGGNFFATISDTGTQLAEGNGKQASRAIHAAYASWKRNGQPVKVSQPAV